MNQFLNRLELALRWAGLTETQLLARCNRFREESIRLLAGDLDQSLPLAAAAIEEMADVLDVGREWLLRGTASIAARRLMLSLHLLCERSRATGASVFDSSDYLGFMVLAESVPGQCPLNDTIDIHQDAGAEARETNGLGRAEGQRIARERSAPSENDVS